VQKKWNIHQIKHVEEISSLQASLSVDATILNYALDMERSHLWVTMQAKNQEAVMDILSTFPIIKEVKVEIFELAFFDSAPMGLPELIMN
jgi:hypothetical protein